MFLSVLTIVGYYLAWLYRHTCQLYAAHMERLNKKKEELPALVDQAEWKFRKNQYGPQHHWGFELTFAILLACFMVFVTCQLYIYQLHGLP